MNRNCRESFDCKKYTCKEYMSTVYRKYVCILKEQQFKLLANSTNQLSRYLISRSALSYVNNIQYKIISIDRFQNNLVSQHNKTIFTFIHKNYKRQYFIINNNKTSHISS